VYEVVWGVSCDIGDDNEDGSCGAAIGGADMGREGGRKGTFRYSVRKGMSCLFMEAESEMMYDMPEATCQKMFSTRIQAPERYALL